MQIIFALPVWIIPPRVPTPYFLEYAFLGVWHKTPFTILGFHSDNSSEFINHVVARLLNTLHIQQTQPCSRQCNDNALVEGKNGAIVRKHMEHMHIPQCYAARTNDFYRNYLNVYLNFHRPSGCAEIKSDAKGKLKKIYKSYFAPFEAFTGHPTASNFLKNGRTLEELSEMAHQQSDNKCTAAMQKAKDHLFTSFPSFKK